MVLKSASALLIIGLIACSPPPPPAAPVPSKLEGMWSDPPKTAVGTFCFFACTDAGIDRLNALLAHAMMYMDATDKGGKAVKWTVEFAGRLNLEEAGWTANSIKVGEKVTVSGNPAWESAQRMAFVKLVRPDGTTLEPGRAQRLSAIEEERRQRALRRTQQK